MLNDLVAFLAVLRVIICTAARCPRLRNDSPFSHVVEHTFVRSGIVAAPVI